MYIKRAMEAVIAQANTMAKVILITGPRQVGKTTMLQERYGSEYEYITLDNYSDLRLAKEDSQLFFKQYPFPIIIDEVQYAPELFRAIKLEVDKVKQKGLVYLTGSQAYHLMKNVSESLAGRVMIFELAGLSLRERFQITYNHAFIPSQSYLQERKADLKPYEAIWEIIHRGAMPELQDPTIRWDWYYRDYVKSYIERDVRDLITIKDETKFFQFLVSMAARSGQLMNYQDIASDIGVSLKTIQNWSSILEASGIIKVIQPYFNNALKRAIKTPKVYFMDTGLLCYLIGWNTPKSAMNGAMSGNIFETFVMSEIIKSFLNEGKDIRNLFYYRDKDKKEIDLIIKEDQILYPVEIKMGAQIRKDWIKNFHVLEKNTEIEVAPGIVICQCDQETYITEKYKAIPIEYI